MALKGLIKANKSKNVKFRTFIMAPFRIFRVLFKCTYSKPGRIEKHVRTLNLPFFKVKTQNIFSMKIFYKLQ